MNRESTFLDLTTAVGIGKVIVLERVLWSRPSKEEKLIKELLKVLDQLEKATSKMVKCDG